MPEPCKCGALDCRRCRPWLPKCPVCGDPACRKTEDECEEHREAEYELARAYDRELDQQKQRSYFDAAYDADHPLV